MTAQSKPVVEAPKTIQKAKPKVVLQQPSKDNNIKKLVVEIYDLLNKIQNGLEA